MLFFFIKNLNLRCFIYEKSIIVDNVTIINSSTSATAFVFAKTSYLNISNIYVNNSNLNGGLFSFERCLPIFMFNILIYGSSGPFIAVTTTNLTL